MKKNFLIFIALHLSCWAAPPAIQQQASCLQLILKQADNAYYNCHESVMSDAAYDALRDQYNQLLTAYPELSHPSSVGAAVDSTNKKIEHTTPILSLQKAKSNEEVERFINKCGRDLLYCIEPKIDGLTIVLHYRNGLLTRALTRGDGKSGSDITTAVLASGAVPSILPHAPAHLDVRGEAFLPLAAFDALNQRRLLSGKPPLKSPRNTASGTLKLKDLSQVAARGLKIQLFELLATEPMPATHTQSLSLLRRIGLPVIDSRTVSGEHALAEINEQLHQLAAYQTDGVVLRIDDRATYTALGFTSHHPRGALARKIKEIPVETRLVRIEWSQNTTGKQTPVAHFDPVELHGATIQKATLHNINHLRTMDLKLGDKILVIRAGGSVPEIIGRVPGKRTGSERPIPLPLAPTPRFSASPDPQLRVE